MYNGKGWSELTPEEHRAYPGDYEAQVGQGPITFHSAEHLASSDKGVTMFRHAFRQGVNAVANGDHVPSPGHYEVQAGNFIG